MDLVWKFKIKLLDEKIFEKYGLEYGCTFSEELKSFIIDNNAASPNKQKIMIDGIERVFDSMLSFNVEENEADTFVQVKEVITEEGIIPFARDPFGNFFCYNDASGLIGFYYSEEEEYVESSYSLETFLDSLYN